MKKKLGNWIHVITHTRTVSGPFLYFQLSYFTFTFVTALGRLKIIKTHKLRTTLEQRLDKEITIKNELGTFSVNPKNDSLTKSITSFESSHQEWINTPATKEIFIDIGANIGFYSILALKKYGYRKAYAFEPSPETFSRLSRNIELNELTQKMFPFAVGISDTESTAELEVKASHTGASSFVKTGSPENSVVTVPVTPFDDFLKTHNISPAHISFIKIDIEGYEYFALQGMKETLTQANPGTCLFIEIHPRASDAEQSHELIKQLSFTLKKQSPQHNFLYVK